jgi:hypothetical protein
MGVSRDEGMRSDINVKEIKIPAVVQIVTK